MHAAKTARLASPEACTAQPLMSALMPVACAVLARRAAMTNAKVNGTITKPASATFDQRAAAVCLICLRSAGAARRNDERQGQWDHHEARVERGKPHCGLHEQRDEKIERDVAEKETERRDEPADKGAIRQQRRFD